MKKIKNIIKHIKFTKIVLIAMTFVVILPISALADDYTYGGNDDTYTYGGNNDTYTYGGNDDTYTYGGNADTYTYGGNYDTYTYGGNYDTYTYGGNDDTYTYGGNTDTYTYGGNTDTYTYGGNYDTYTYGGDYDTYTVASGGYYGGGYTYMPTTYYDYPMSTVSSGGFYGGTTYIAPSTIYMPPTSTVTSGSFSGGSIATLPPVYVQSPSTVTSGGFSGGTTYITPPTTYVYQPATVTSGSFSGGTTSITPPTQYVYQPSTVSSGSFSGGSPLYYYSQPTVIPNQVLSYTITNPGLSSVYLSEVPNTGFEDYYGTILFITILLSWSAMSAYVFLKRKIKAQAVFANAFIDTRRMTETNDTNSSVHSDFIKQIISDNSDVNKIEEYARKNKVLLSSDASIKLIKLSRLGQMNISKFIKKVAMGEWVAVGEDQVK